MSGMAALLMKQRCVDCRSNRPLAERGNQRRPEKVPVWEMISDSVERKWISEPSEGLAD